MLTRHFYELSEVAIALHDSLRRGDGREALFWSRELLLSEEEDLLNLTVIQAWTVWLGAPAVAWLEAWTQVGPDVGGCKRMTLVVEFTGLRRSLGRRRAPHTLQGFIMVARGFAPVADTERVVAALETNDFFTLYRYIGPEYAKSPSNLIEAVAAFVETPGLFDGFRNAIKTLRGEIQLKHLIAASAVQTLCLPEWPAELVMGAQGEVAAWLEEWEPTIGLRSGRIYPIKPTILPRNHKRGQLTYGSATELMKEGCHFWQSILELGTESLVDGLPSSWSIEEQNRSHSYESGGCCSARTIIKPADRMRIVWGFSPALRKTWALPLKKLFDAVALPEH